MFQRGFGTKKVLQARRGVFGKFNQEVHIAAGRVEVICPCCRAKHFQAAYVEALADGGDAGTVLGDGRVLGGILGDGIQIGTYSAHERAANAGAEPPAGRHVVQADQYDVMWAPIGRCSSDTALRDINDLLTRGAEY